jgi:hypothetical protein
MSKETVTITLWEQQFEVTGNYTPYNPGVRYYPDGSGQPPDPAEFEIEEMVWVKKLKEGNLHTIAVDITDLILDIDNSVPKGDIYEEITEAVIDEIEKG